jgi:hypothetical protein
MTNSGKVTDSGKVTNSGKVADPGKVPNPDEAKPATAARIYDYHLGGTHNFPADREAAQAMATMFPLLPALVRNNRAFLRRAVRFLSDAGVRQFVDIGSGIPTEGNVHEVAAPGSRVAYVDIDPVAVSESLDILEGNANAVAVRGDVRDPGAILAHPRIRGLIDFEQPVGLLLLAVLHFIPDEELAQSSVAKLLAALAPGSYLVICHASAEGATVDQDNLDAAHDLYERRTSTPFHLRTREQMTQFFTGAQLVEPGVVWLPEWHPAPDDPTDFTENPAVSAGLVGVGFVGAGRAGASSSD